MFVYESGPVLWFGNTTAPRSGVSSPST